MKTWSLRQKLALWSAVVIIATLLPVGGFTVLSVYLNQMRAMDQRLIETAEHFLEMARMHKAEPGWMHEHVFLKIFHPGGTPERFVEVIHHDGTLLYRSENLSPGRFAAGPEGLSTLHAERETLRLLVLADEDLIVRFALDISETRSVAKDLILAYVIALPFVLGSAWFGCQLIARVALGRVSRVADAAQEISAEHLDRRLPLSNVGDEIDRLSQVLNELFDRLDVSFHQTKRFSADASHELKTPLTVLRSGIEDLLEQPSFSLEVKVALASLLEQTNKLVSIIENLLLLARMDSSQLKLDLQEQNVRPILEDCLDDAEALGTAQNITVTAQLPEALPVRTDKIRLTQILLNLLSNAIKYNIPDGRLTVDASLKDKQCCIKIANTSTAKLDEQREELFQRFFRGVHSSTEPGHGLGLSIARELARAHGGELSLLRSDGVWTEFLLTLPASSS